MAPPPLRGRGGHRRRRGAGESGSGSEVACAPPFSPSVNCSSGRDKDEAGCSEISLGDTIGVGTPGTECSCQPAAAHEGAHGQAELHHATTTHIG